MISIDESVCEELRLIALGYAENSKQYESLKVASACVLYILTEHRPAFSEYVESMDKPLSEEQIEVLKKMGL